MVNVKGQLEAKKPLTNEQRLWLLVLEQALDEVGHGPFCSPRSYRDALEWLTAINSPPRTGSVLWVCEILGIEYSQVIREYQSRIRQWYESVSTSAAGQSAASYIPDRIPDSDLTRRLEDESSPQVLNLEPGEKLMVESSSESSEGAADSPLTGPNSPPKDRNGSGSA